MRYSIRGDSLKTSVFDTDSPDVLDITVDKLYNTNPGDTPPLPLPGPR